MTFQRGLILGSVVLLAGVGAFVMLWNRPATNPQSPAGNASHRAEPVPPQATPLRFTSMTEGSGIDFLYYGGPSPLARMTEQNGGGVAVVDFDQDGHLDLFLVNGSSFETPAEGLAQSSRLYRGTQPFQYRDATVNAGLVSHGFGMGAAAADYDNDGFTDLFVAYYGRDRLWHNNGDGTFTEVTDTAGVGCELWGASPAWADLDADGLLDLFVTNYVEWSPKDPLCRAANHPEIVTICSPMERKGQPNALYRNLGDGRFEELGESVGVALPEGKGLAVGIADFDGDARLDIYVANDTTPKFLFQNLGGMKFREVGVVQGVAVSGDGTVGAGMGVAIADIDHNGRLDLCVTNFRNQANDVFANLGDAGFSAVNAQMGVDLVSRAPLAFGIVLADFDLDSWPDMFVANGHIWDLTSIGSEFEYAMHPQVLWNRAGKRYTDASKTAGDYFTRRWLGRAVALGDLDDDGDADLVVSHLMAPSALLRNDSPGTLPSVRITLVGTRSARQPLGTGMTVVTSAGTLVTQVPAGGSFQASHDPRVLVALPGDLQEVHVAWRKDTVEVWRNPVPDGNGDLRLVEGTGGVVVGTLPVPSERR